MTQTTLHTPHTPIVKAGPEPGAGVPPPLAALLPGWAGRENYLPDGLLLLPQRRDAGPTRRVVVLVPEREFKESELARKIWGLAAPGSLAVLFLARAPQTGNSFRSRLATLAAITRDEKVQASACISTHSQWPAAVEEVWNPGDLLVIPGKPGGRIWDFGQEQLGFYLGERFELPVYFLTGLKLGASLAGKNLAMQCLGWSASLAILVAFFWLQIQIEAALSGWVSTLAFILSVMVEIGLLLFVNSRTS